MRRWPGFPPDRRQWPGRWLCPMQLLMHRSQGMVHIGRDSSSPTPCSSRIPWTALLRIVSRWLLISPGKETPEPLCASAQSPSQYRSSSSGTEVGAQKSRAQSFPCTVDIFQTRVWRSPQLRWSWCSAVPGDAFLHLHLPVAEISPWTPALTKGYKLKYIAHAFFHMWNSNDCCRSQGLHNLDQVLAFLPCPHLQIPSTCVPGKGKSAPRSLGGVNGKW